MRFGGLIKDSVINVSQIVNLDRSRFVKKAGNLKSKLLEKVEESLNIILSIK
ncbi:type II toxin-antitoxin system PemK/MazF family toxin [Leptospira ilyithenensis]|uniref:type II toxin-antitoxin system PemK/MazF family toxin n=1 Tax=Leptospira ilyithenensis TaxID=2484901 RepID=UPI001FE81D97|nr:type II toxin-antitoxin system PemK/MazF family toxin [Leptospira ilyithenensis]